VKGFLRRANTVTTYSSIFFAVLLRYQSPCPNNTILVIIYALQRYLMGRIVPPFRQLYQETVSDLTTELKGAMVDLGHKSAFDLLLKEAWNPEVAAMGNSTLPTVCDKLNVMSTIHLRKLIATLVRENGQRDGVIEKLEERIKMIEDRLKEMKQPSNVTI